MSDPNRNNGNTDDLLRTVFKDDLPPDVQRSMKARFAQFRTTLDATGRTEPWKDFFDLGNRPLLRWIPAKEVLAFFSLLMMVLGGFLHVSGARSAMAETMSFVNTSVAISDRLLSVTSMECRLQFLSEDGHSADATIRWLAPETIRVDIRQGDDTNKSLWIADSDVALVDRIGHSFNEYESVEEVEESLFEPILGFLSPNRLSEAIYGKWKPKRYEVTENEERLTLVYTNSEGKTLLEMTVDLSNDLPTSIKKFASKGADSEAAKEQILEARFVWDEPISSQLMIPER